jgi:hypothetical protein
LPRYGLELKLLSVFILFRAQDILWTNMIVCQRFFLKKWIKKTHIVVSFIVLISSFFSLFLFFRPHKSIILPGDVVLYPTEDYTLFTYELDQ